MLSFFMSFLVTDPSEFAVLYAATALSLNRKSSKVGYKSKVN